MIYLFLWLTLFISALNSFFVSNTSRDSNIWALKYLFFLIAFSLFVLIAGFRYEIGLPDWFEYKRVFEEVSSGYFDTRFEVGYLYYNYLLSYISNDAQIVFITTSLFVSCVTYYFYRQVLGPKYYHLAILIYVVTLYFNLNMYNVRQHIALSICLISIVFYSRENYIKWLLLVFIASFFHKSALVFLIVTPLMRLQYNKKLLLFSFTFGYILMILGIQFSDFILNALKNIEYFKRVIDLSMSIDGLNEPRKGNLLGLTERFLSLYAVIYFYDKLVNKGSIEKIVTNGFLVYNFIYLFLYGYAFFIIRFNLYFAIFLPLIYVMLLSLMNYRNQVIGFCVLVFYTYFKWSIYIYSQSLNHNTFVPYRSFLDSLY